MTDGESSIDVTAFRVEAADGYVGTVDEATREAGGSFVVLDPDPRFFAKKIMLPRDVVDSVDADARVVRVAWTKEQMKDAPQYEDDPAHRGAGETDVIPYYDHELTPFDGPSAA